jgi:urease accessory protein UreF
MTPETLIARMAEAWAERDAERMRELDARLDAERETIRRRSAGVRRGRAERAAARAGAGPAPQ